jgi:hypothetical protein
VGLIRGSTGILSSGSIPEDVSNAHPKAVQNLLQGVQSDVLFTYFQPLQGRAGQAGNLTEIPQGPFASFLPKKLAELFAE